MEQPTKFHSSVKLPCPAHHLLDADRTWEHQVKACSPLTQSETQQEQAVGWIHAIYSQCTLLRENTLFVYILQQGPKMKNLNRSLYTWSATYLFRGTKRYIAAIKTAIRAQHNPMYSHSVNNAVLEVWNAMCPEFCQMSSGRWQISYFPCIPIRFSKNESN